jgi:hypothetical protein
MEFETDLFGGIAPVGAFVAWDALHISSSAA